MNQSFKNYSDFIGRRAIINKIYARIGAGRPQSVSIVGDAKIGKSALLWYLAHTDTRRQFLANSEDYIYLYISCRELNPATLENFSRRLYRLTSEYAPVKDETNYSKFNYNHYKHLIESLHKQHKKIILFLDDFNLITLNPAFPLEFFSFLRSLANNYNVAYVTTSYEDLQKLCVSKDIEESPFFNIFTNMSLRGFEDSEIEQFLDLICHAADADASTYKSYLINLAGRFPYPLQVVCKGLKADSGKILSGGPEIERQLFENLQDHFQVVWDRLEVAHKDVLKLLSAGKRIPAGLQYLLRDLSKKNYITYNGSSEAAIDGLLFRHFVARRAGIAIRNTQSGKKEHRLKGWLKRALGIIKGL